MTAENILHFRWQNIVDFVVLLLAVYLILLWGKYARALRVALGILGLRAGSLLARQLDLVLTAWVLDAASIVTVVLLPVVFQPELRYALMQMDGVVQQWRRRRRSLGSGFRALSEAAFALAETGRGALIAVARKDPVEGLVSGGVPLGGEISREILEAIFRKVSPVHDGATVIHGDRISRVAAILPLSDRTDLPSVYGTRHRAAFGLTERCDAIVVAVSEQRGTVTLVHGRQFREANSPAELARELQVLYARTTVPATKRLADGLRKDLGLKAAAVAFALLIWFSGLALPGAALRDGTVPVELTNIPRGLRVAQQSATTLHVQLRGTSWLLDSLNFSRLVAQVDLRGSSRGTRTISVRLKALHLPPGIRIEGMSPEDISVSLVEDPTVVPAHR